MKHKVIVKDWQTECSDGCCYDYGTQFVINGEVITEYLDLDVEEVVAILKALKIKFELEYIDSFGCESKVRN